MPPYFYHLKFELYATSDPIAATAPPPRADVAKLWIPPRDTSIFEVLPSHNSRLLRSPPPHSESRPRSASHPPVPAPASSSSIPSSGSPPSSLPAVIDCGAYRRPSDRGPPDGGASLVRISELGGGGQARVPSFPPPSSSAAIRPGTAVSDWRFGQLTIESVDLEDMTMPRPDAEPAPPAGEPAHDRGGGHASEGLGPRFPGSGTSTRAQFLPIQSRSTSIGWGVVHFYRESKETPALSLPPGLFAPAASSDGDGDGGEQDCTTLCIPAVPSYMSPSDFLGFVGEKWKADISHYRMVMSPKMNKYLVLMKARNHNRAREWKKEFDGKVFNTMESQICHVVFVRSITFESPLPMAADAGAKPSAPASPALSKSSTWGSLKPFPPPTPDLVELPTCPVCLERMDDTTGLMTIPCQHIFHCSCLQNWSGSGCPVCRHTNPDGTAAPLEFGTGTGAGIGIASDALAQPFGGSAVSNLCRVCDCTEDLWICLVCGTVGCGRYRGGHAKEHWKETAHSFALELGTQYVWDYAGDTWVHRLIREKGGGKFMDLPESTNRPGSGNGNGNGPRSGSGGEEEMVPRAKLDNIGLEYAHLISSQLESQRAYYEEMVNKAADKAARAAAEADRAAAQAAAASRQLRELQDRFQAVSAGTVPQLERDLERERSRAVKAQDLARSLGRSLQEEKGVGEGLLVRVQHVNTEKEELQRRIEELKGEIEDLREMNTDLTAFISGQEKLKELEASGKVTEAELEGSNVGVQGKERRRRRKN